MADDDGYTSSNIRQESSNADYGSTNSLEIRLRTDELLARVDSSLRGEAIILEQNKDGDVRERRVTTGKYRLVNDKGVDTIMTAIFGVINQHAFQGNISRADYGKLMTWFDSEFIDLLHINMYDWQVQESDLKAIRLAVIPIVSIALTRPIDNEERKSFQTAITHHDVGSMQPNRQAGGFGIFKR